MLKSWIELYVKIFQIMKLFWEYSKVTSIYQNLFHWIYVEQEYCRRARLQGKLLKSIPEV
jgi:hypothetical protein